MRARLGTLGLVMTLVACASEPIPNVAVAPPPPRSAETPVPPPPLVLDGALEQGGLLFGKTAPNVRRISVDGQPVLVGDDGDFLVGIPREAGPAMLLRAEADDGGITERTLEIAPREFRIERINGPKFDTSRPMPADIAARRAREAERIATARAALMAHTAWRGPWVWPAVGRISGVYGSQRILNGVPRAPHWGVDIAAPTGTPVIAPAPGIIRLAGSGFMLEGGLVILDHGQGLFSQFLHLSRIDVTEGQEVKTGDRIGAIGATGRATGPHLHWGLVVRDTRVDPTRVPGLGPMPAELQTAGRSGNTAR